MYCALGDVNPVEHGGFWVLRDKTGSYCEEAELFDVDSRQLAACRFTLNRCTFINGVLSDNKYHPDKCAWFATTPERMKLRPQDGRGLTDVARTVGIEEDELVRLLCSESPIERCRGYQCLIAHHGVYEFDQYPLYLSRSEAKRRYKAKMYRVT